MYFKYSLPVANVVIYVTDILIYGWNPIGRLDSKDQCPSWESNSHSASDFYGIGTYLTVFTTAWHWSLPRATSRKFSYVFMWQHILFHCRILILTEYEQFDFSTKTAPLSRSHRFWWLYECASKSFRTESITKYTFTTINTRWEATLRVIALKLTRLTYKIAIQLDLVAESYTICSSRSRRPVRKLLHTLLYTGAPAHTHSHQHSNDHTHQCNLSKPTMGKLFLLISVFFCALRCHLLTEVKVKVFLYLIKHNVMKAYCGSGGIAQHS
jgi:hypothetical protein